MKLFSKDRFDTIQTVLAFLLGPILMIVLLLLKLGEKGVYIQIAALLLVGGGLFLYLWKQKQYDEIKDRVSRTVILLIAVTIITYVYKRQYVIPKTEEIMLKSQSKP